MAEWSCRIEPPPSTNSLYSGRRHKTKAYKRWIERNGWLIKLSPEGTDSGSSVTALANPFTTFRRCAVEIKLPFDYAADIDNALKATLDLLQAMRVIENDKHVERISVERSRGATMCEVRVIQIGGGGTPAP